MAGWFDWGPPSAIVYTIKRYCIYYSINPGYYCKLHALHYIQKNLSGDSGGIFPTLLTGGGTFIIYVTFSYNIRITVYENN